MFSSGDVAAAIPWSQATDALYRRFRRARGEDTPVVILIWRYGDCGRWYWDLKITEGSVPVRDCRTDIVDQVAHVTMLKDGYEARIQEMIGEGGLLVLPYRAVIVDYLQSLEVRFSILCPERKYMTDSMELLYLMESHEVRDEIRGEVDWVYDGGTGAVATIQLTENNSFETGVRRVLKAELLEAKLEAKSKKGWFK